eukprot:Gb_10856 [translate_table: standard]
MLIILYVGSDISPCDHRNSALELKSVKKSSNGLPIAIPLRLKIFTFLFDWTIRSANWGI